MSCRQRAHAAVGAQLFDDVREVGWRQPQQSAVAQRGDKLSVSLKQPSRIDRGDVGHASIDVKSNGMSLWRLLGRRRLVIGSGRQVENVPESVIGSRQLKLGRRDVNSCGRHVSLVPGSLQTPSR